MPRLYESRKRILVSGGAGFLGSHLIGRLLEEGHDVLCVDNFFTGTKRNIEEFRGNRLHWSYYIFPDAASALDCCPSLRLALSQ